MAKKVTTTSAINVAAMGKAGEMTGLKTEKSEGLPRAIQQLGMFTMNQYFRAAALQDNARTSMLTEKGNVISKQHIQDNTSIREEIEKNYAELIKINQKINNPWNITFPNNKSRKELQLKREEILLDVQSLDSGFEDLASDKTNFMQVAIGAKYENGQYITWSGNSTANQRVLSNALANSSIETAIEFVKNPNNNRKELYVNLSLIDWNGDEDGLGEIPDEYNSLIKQDNKSKDILVNYKDLKKGGYFADLSDKNVDNALFTQILGSAVQIGSGDTKLTLSSAQGQRVFNEFKNKFDKYSPQMIKDAFFRLDIEGATFAERYIDRVINEGAKSDDKFAEKIAGLLEDGYSKVALIELMKEGANKNNFSWEEMKTIINDETFELAKAVNQHAIDDRLEYEEEIESENQPWNKPGYISKTTTRNDIKKSIANNSIYTAPNGSRYIWSAGSETFYKEGYPTGTKWNPSELASAISGEKYIVKNRGEHWWKK